MLSPLEIKHAQPKDKPYKIYDGEGLYFLIRPNGAKYARFKYRFKGKEKLLALGVWNDGLKKDERSGQLASFRAKRAEAQALLKNSIDPNQHKKQMQREADNITANTFELIAHEWHGLNKNKWTEKHANKNLRRLEMHLFPEFGHLPITEVKAKHLLDAIRKVEERGHTDVTKRLVQLASSIFRHAIITERATYNPAQDLRGALKSHVTKNYPTIHESELSQFFQDLRDANTSDLNRYAMKLAMLTFLRPGELRQSLWEYIDFEQKTWSLPEEAMKKDREHVVPLSRQTVNLLRQVKALTGNDKYIFPSQNFIKNPTMSEGTLTQMLKRMGYKDRMSWHGVRALASTTMREIGNFDDLVIEKQLSHKDPNKSRAPYNRAQYFEQREKLMQWWGDFLESRGLYA